MTNKNDDDKNEKKQNSYTAYIIYLMSICALVSAFCISLLTKNPSKTPNYLVKIINYVLKSQLSLDKYPNNINLYRKLKMPHIFNETYLDYTGAGVYPDELIDKVTDKLLKHQFLNQRVTGYSGKTSDEIIEKARNKLLKFLGTNSGDYTVVFVASATQALKLLAETFPWGNDTTFHYTRYNHNSVLGMRKYALSKGANFEVIHDTSDVSKNIEKLASTRELKHMFVLPLEDNFAGTKVSKKEMHKLTHDKSDRKDGYAVVADAAAFLPSNKLSLSEYPFHAICMSFYKIFGFPNSGALVIRKDFANRLKKNFYTSKSASFVLSSNEYAELHDSVQQRFEDDDVSPELAYALIESIKYFEKLGMDKIEKHVSRLTKKLYEHLSDAGAIIYGNHKYNNSEIQGGIVAFNIRLVNGSIYGYSKVVEEASMSGFHLRGGCHCNPGACFEATTLSEEQVKKYFDKKKTCGDSLDIVDGIPLGAVRASVGWATTDDDIERFASWVKENYLV